MKAILGALLILCGVLAGGYVGIWWGFIGGIIDGVEAIKATPVDAALLAWGAAKVFILASLCGWLSAVAFILPGVALLKSDSGW